MANPVSVGYLVVIRMFVDRRACFIALLALAIGCAAKKPQVTRVANTQHACSFGLVAVSLGCASNIGRVRRPANNDMGRMVRKVIIRGNKTFSDSTLYSGLANRPPIGRLFRDEQPYDPVEIRRDRARIESYYRARGYFTAKVILVDVKRLVGDQVDITFTVREGPLTTIRSFVVKLAKEQAGVRTTTLVKIAELPVGAAMEYDEYDDAKDRIRAHLVRAGYAFADVEGKIRVDRRISKADVEMTVSPGPLAKFGKVKIKGLKRIPEESLRARFSFEPGKPFSSAKLVESRRRLYALGVFSTVTLEYDKLRKPEVADITVRVREGKRHEIKLGGGAGIDNTSYAIRGRAAYSEKGFLVPLLTLRLEAKPSVTLLRQDLKTLGLGFEASAGLTKQDFIRPLWHADATLTYTARAFTAYSIQGPRVTFGVARKLLGDRLRIGFGWQFRFQTFLGDQVPRGETDTAERRRAEIELDELGIKWAEKTGYDIYRLGVLQQSIAYDGRDSPIRTRRGVYVSLRLEEAGAYAGSAFSYIRILPELRAYMSLGERIVFAARAKYGRTLTGEVLPITERFFVGGGSSQRGFGLQRLSPRIFDDRVSEPVGGRAMVETGAEVRLDLVKLFSNWLGLAGFIDGGDATRDPADLSMSNLHWAAGFGLRLRTLIGPVRADIAWRLNRKGTGTLDALETYAWHLSLGEAF